MVKDRLTVASAAWLLFEMRLVVCLIRCLMDSPAREMMDWRGSERRGCTVNCSSVKSTLWKKKKKIRFNAS